jgi:predicted AlkP superfamily pyrophosphatase or phosphodiesterase
MPFVLLGLTAEKPMEKKRLFLLVMCLAAVLASLAAQPTPRRALPNHRRVQRVLLISIDGFHAVDLANYVKLRPNSALARLSTHGITYTNAATSFPSNSWPGLTALITGGSSVSTGIIFENNYDRSLSPPGSDCSTRGTDVILDGSIDINNKALDGGGGINPDKLPRDPSKGCKPVYPHDFLRVNTIFEAIHEAGGRTAWSDKHLAYDFTNGPSGHGVDDLFTPEVRNASASRNLPNIEQFDDLRVEALIHEIDGRDHTGSKPAAVPTIFGMNFQAVSAGQKLKGEFGYTDANGTPTANLLDAMDHTDRSIGRMVDELQVKGLAQSTLVIVTAKHGDTPIDPAKSQPADLSIIPAVVEGVQKGLLARANQDGSVALIWLKDQSRTNDVVAALRAQQAKARIQQIFAGESLKLRFNDPLTDPRVPDIIIQPELGTIYVEPGDFIAEHGGMADPDVHVALLLSMAQLEARTIKSPVQTMQVAPTIMRTLGLDPYLLRAVQIEKTAALPGLRFDPDFVLD